MPARTKAGFVEPMLVGGRVHFRSRNDKYFNARYAAIVRGLAKLPSDTVIDGELIALGDDGRPSFNALQNDGSASTPILYFVFHVMVLEGRDVKTGAFQICSW